jgi:hypothetical protein
MSKAAVMKSTGNPFLALCGLGALLAYILACTSFSPDDTKVLYPTVDPESGVIGMAVYDRTSRKSEVLLIPQQHDLTSRAESHQLILRPQWLSNGRDLLVAWTDVDRSGDDHDEELHVALLTRHGHGAVRLFQLNGLSSALTYVHLPLPVAGKALYLTSKSNEVVRLDLVTGQTRRASLLPETVLLLGPDDQSLVYLRKLGGDRTRYEFGTLQAESLAQTGRGELDLGESEGVPIISRDGRHIAALSGKSKPPAVLLVSPGVPPHELPIHSLRPEAALSNGQFSPNGKVFYAGYMEFNRETTNTTFGFVEIPINGGEERKTVLVNGQWEGQESDALLFPIEISHDGRTLAACSSYLALHHELKAEDCGLFLVDLTHPERRSLRVPVARPMVR